MLACKAQQLTAFAHMSQTAQTPSTHSPKSGPQTTSACRALLPHTAAPPHGTHSSTLCHTRKGQPGPPPPAEQCCSRAPMSLRSTSCACSNPASRRQLRARAAARPAHARPQSTVTSWCGLSCSSDLGTWARARAQAWYMPRLCMCTRALSRSTCGHQTHSFHGGKRRRPLHGGKRRRHGRLSKFSSIAWT